MAPLSCANYITVCLAYSQLLYRSDFSHATIPHSAAIKTDWKDCQFLSPLILVCLSPEIESFLATHQELVVYVFLLNFYVRATIDAAPIESSMLGELQ